MEKKNKEKKLKKELGALDVFCLASGSMISSGLFVLPAIAYQIGDAQILTAYFVAGLLIIPSLFSKLELATAIPKAGGTYFYTERILGSAAGVVNGFANWFSISLKSAFALIGIGTFAKILFPQITPLMIKLIACGFCLLFFALNLVSTKHAGRFQIFFVFALLLILAQFVLFGYRAVDYSQFTSLVKLDFDKIWLIAGMVFISYGGLTKVASIAEEVKNPGVNLVKGTIHAYWIVQLLYLLVIFILIGVLPANVFKKTLTPLTEAVNYIFPKQPFFQIELFLITIAGSLAFITTANAGLMAASRSPMAMSRDSFLPALFSRLTKKKKTPLIALTTTTLFMLIIILVLNIEKLAKVASLFMLLLFIMVNLSVIVIRYSRLSNYRPIFKSPFFPLLQIAGIIFYTWLIVKMGFFILGISVGFILLSLFWYFIYAKKREKRKSAFVEMVEKITNPELGTTQQGLEDELLDILIDRNEIVEDRFDNIIRQSPVLDYRETITRKQLFRNIAEIIAAKWQVDVDSLEKKLNNREEESSTLIYPGVAVPHAIPHVVVEGTHKFDIVLVRNKYGIKWNEEGDVVYTAFSLIGSKDERNFHLRCLMAIAHILQDPDFHNAWHQAKSETELKTIILITKRKRLPFQPNQ